MLSEEANTYLQQYVPERSARVAEEESDVLSCKPSDLQITSLTKEVLQFVLLLLLTIS